MKLWNKVYSKIKGGGGYDYDCDGVWMRMNNKIIRMHESVEYGEMGRGCNGVYLMTDCCEN